jgi:hypothetical protein
VQPADGQGGLREALLHAPAVSVEEQPGSEEVGAVTQTVLEGRDEADSALTTPDEENVAFQQRLRRLPIS